MTFNLTANFLRNARAVIFQDSASVTWSFNANSNQITAVGASGGLTSVGLSDASTTPIYTVGSSPLVANGTLTITFKTQSANTILAGPTTGSAAQPTFRAMVTADLPTSVAPTSGSFTGTLTGVSGTAPTCTVVWSRIGNVVTLTVNSTNATVTGTSNGSGLTLTGLPTALQPATAFAVVTTNGLFDNGAATTGQMQITPASGTISFSKGTSASFASWTSTGTKGLEWPITITYPLT